MLSLKHYPYFHLRNQKMNEFYLKEKSIDLELSTGSYQIFFTGGWFIKNLEELDVELIDIETNKKIALISNNFFGLRKQDFIKGQKAVLAFQFNLVKSSRLTFSIHNPETLLLQKVHPFLFLYNIFFPRKVEVDKIRVVIR